VRTAIHAVKPAHGATFLGRKLTGNYADDLGNDFHTRLAGTRLKHHRGPVALKLYDKQALVLRIETTVNDVSFFRHHRTVEQRDGTTETKLAPMRRTLYSRGPLRDLLVAAKRRYLAFLSDLSDPSGGVPQIAQVAEPTRQDDRSYRGFNLFSSARTTWPSSPPWHAVRGRSVASATATCGGSCRTIPVRSSRACSNACTSMASSRRWGAPTSTTSRTPASRPS
jgi:hypothetical protein